CCGCQADEVARGHCSPGWRLLWVTAALSWSGNCSHAAGLQFLRELSRFFGGASEQKLGWGSIQFLQFGVTHALKVSASLFRYPDDPPAKNPHTFCFLMSPKNASSTRPECSIMQEIEEERSQCLAELTWDNQTSGNVTRNCTSQGWSDVYPAPYAVACGYDSNSTPGEEVYLLFRNVSFLPNRKLHCTRNYIHMHLFMSFIMRAIAVFIKDVILFESGESEHCFVSSVGCKAMMVFFQYCVMANFFWLLVEGLYLHTLLVPPPCSSLPGPLCWEEIVESPFWWIIKTPILVSILVNFILFICIIRILVQKLHSPDVGHNETSQYSRLAKSTLLLIPLFGIHYIMFAFFPDNFKAEVKLVFELVVGSFQGFVVAVLYCFLNGEVQAELKRKWRRWHLERFLGSDMKYHHPSLGSNGTNFSTQISMLTKCSPKTRRCSGFQAEFSLV
ncbi:hypothetical protein IHE44_0000070, partial [Lamprotornis superbus]